MGHTIVGSIFALLVVAPLFAWLSRRWSTGTLPRRSRSAWITDLTYWVVSPAVVRPLVRATTLAIVGVWAVVWTQSLDPDTWVTAFSSHSPIARQPRWLQGIEMVLLGEFLGYWVHRAFHRGAWWRLHAVHHSSRRLDWLASVRIHPLNELIGGVLRIFPLFVLGFRLDLLAGYLPGLALYGLLLHADVRWDFGPLRWVLASPAFHRWHHSADAEGRDVNFAGLLPGFDLIFGTFHLPRGRFPTHTAAPVPEGWWAQLRHPFQTRMRSGKTLRRTT
jgi:sterol desaturase/sphingolipid hydroxylase (fatty acid hydroxylase superfamily)